MRELSDVRAVSDLRVTTQGVRKMVDHDAKQYPTLNKYRLAIVAGTGEVFGMARMYQMLTEHNLPHVAVFTDYDTAARWIAAESSS
jgi:hypothetical protein